MGTLGILLSLALLLLLAYRGLNERLLAPLLCKPMDDSCSARAIAHGIVAKRGSQPPRVVHVHLRQHRGAPRGRAGHGDDPGHPVRQFLSNRPVAAAHGRDRGSRTWD
ncbi:hypothetical protein PH586_14730 [Pseudomonas sp. SA3-5]|uniref:Secreted protein n=1 Tax=Pseudomonas aestuarii TaxID=3018340 RepID=A0ABT4XHL8_9PSED|nr:hypothetical protein [Pseudomonas aestuarii]MDA7087643.1 hypothetical protein [Pseudomonas aestuarii]